MYLVIVESPKKIKTIQPFLGKDYKVISSLGHVYNLPKDDLGIDIEKNFKQKLVPIKGKEDVIKEIKELSSKADKIFLAADGDREGEAIAFHLKKIIGPKKEVYRVIFNSLTKDVVQKNIKEPLEFDENQYNAQKARRALDRLIGYKVSPILWNKIGGNLSAGRVQSVALRIIVEREEEIRKFVSDKSFKIILNLSKEDDKETIIEAFYHGESIENKIPLKEDYQVNKILSEIKNKDLLLYKIEKKEKLTKTPAPFETSTMQQEASLKLKLKPKETMKIAQKLYEGKNFKNYGSTGLITYMRTDSLRIDPTKVEELRNYIKENIGEEHLPEKAINHEPASSDKIQDAHEAIRPANLSITPDSIKDELTLEEFQLYNLIWKRFVASQMKDMVEEETIYWTKVDNNIFKSTGKVLIYEGFKQIYNFSSKTKNEDDKKLPDLEEKSILKQNKEAEVKEQFTSPPPRYTEATLVKELSKRGIGRPATTAGIIETIEVRNYVRQFQGKFQPTELGEVLCNVLVRDFPKQMDIKFTANVEKQLDQIANGKLKMKDVLSSFWNDLYEKIKEAYGTKGLKPESIPLEKKCEKCDNGHLFLHWVNSVEIAYCDRCDFKSPVKIKDYDSIEFVQINDEDHRPCSKCGGIMQKRKGKWGDFWACTSWPACDNTMPMTTGVKCPVCKKGDYVKKKTKTGKIMYGCTEFPNCKEVLWNKPLKRRCIHCSYTVLEQYDNGKLRCANPKCKKYNN
jgi:DNA topoisomerase-1